VAAHRSHLELGRLTLKSKREEVSNIKKKKVGMKKYQLKKKRTGTKERKIYLYLTGIIGISDNKKL
jgi:hypothetical protein